MSRRHVAAIALFLLVVGTLAACATMGDQAATPSLYKRLGGREGIAQVVDDFVANMAADPRTKGRFAGMPPPAVFKLRSNLADQICDATGGPCSYLGRDMKTAHTGMGVSEAEWSATVENLGKALDKFKVGAKEKQELIGVLAPMKSDIVGR
ncbi:MAG: group 1 truncated hemoglobin [Candidatus Rokubacteria bacterium]|nr:group 1 truncated hemoglobin [Candidatus Rokubacteria bacterium]